MKTAANNNRIHRDELHGALEQVLSEHFEATCRIRKLGRRRSAYSSSYIIENLAVELEGGRRLSLVVKDLSPASLLTTAQKVRPHFLYDPLREIESYLDILNPQCLGTPICYGSVQSRELERYWLFLERVPGPLLWQRGRMDSWETAARWLARLHGAFDTANRPPALAQAEHLLRYNGRFFYMWLKRAEEFMRHKHTASSPETCRRFGRLVDRYDRVVQRLLELPTTFIHGEFYPSNVIVRVNQPGRPVCPLDWELAAVAPGLVDVAALTAGNWTEEKRRKMLAAYRDELTAARGRPPGMADLIEGVEYCQLHLAVQLLGWASDWSPPRKHAQNWLREAFRLAGKLGLWATRQPNGKSPRPLPHMEYSSAEPALA
jgi:hypothetical protein